MKWINAEKDINDFIQQDLPFLVKPHCQDTMYIIEQYFEEVINISIDKIVENCPNFIEQVHEQVYRYFYYYISQGNFNRNSGFYAYYSSLAIKFQNEDIYKLVELQVSNETINTIINNCSNSYVIRV